MRLQNGCEREKKKRGKLPRKQLNEPRKQPEKQKKLLGKQPKKPRKS